MKPNAQLLSVQLGMFWSQARGFETRARFLSHSAREIQKKGILHLSSFSLEANLELMAVDKATPANESKQYLYS